MASKPEAAADPVDVAVGARIRLLRKLIIVGFAGY